MKKTAIALAIAGLAAATVAQAAPEANSFYLGAKAGWTSAHDGIRQFDTKYIGDTRYSSVYQGFGINRNSVTYGVFAGYQIIDNLALELGYDYFGRVRGNVTFPGDKTDKTAFKHSAHGTSLSFKPSYEIASGLDVYGKVGAALVRNDYYVQADIRKSSRFKAHNLKTSLVLGAGLEYAITPALAARVEYQWLSRVGNLDKAFAKEGAIETTSYSPDFHSVSAGLSYRFGQGSAVAPELVKEIYTLNSDVTFAFAKATLKPEAATSLDAIYDKITQVSSPKVAVNGYADRIGKDAANLKLSQRRAETVANYLVSKGVDAGSVTATGFGEANPVTGNTCDAVKGRKALIACLAPDRRVEIEVQGNKQVTM